jgi:hypothetical protein
MTAAIRDWPGFMRKSTAAKYCDMSVVDFEKAVMSGEMPMPIRINGEPRWVRADIDARAKGATDLGIDDWRKDAPIYAQK